MIWLLVTHVTRNIFRMVCPPGRATTFSSPPAPSNIRRTAAGVAVISMGVVGVGLIHPIRGGRYFIYRPIES